MSGRLPKGPTSEKEWQSTVLDLATLGGWRSYHTFDSRRSAAGFPDLVLVRPPVVRFIELKAGTGKLRPKQRAWLDDLKDCESVEAHLWRPSDWDRIEEMLTRPRKRGAA